MEKQQDGYGQALVDYFEGRGGYEIDERDDGHIAPSGGPPNYLRPYRRWPCRERRALRFARGRVLDVGCGAGRVALYLQEKGFPVIGIDISPGAIDVCRRRGLADARVLSIQDVSPKLGTFDTIVMFGNNFGLFGSRAGAKRLLARFHRMTSARGRILAESCDPYRTDDLVHLRYHARNHKRGRMPGQLRLRIRYRDLATPWFDYLLVSPDEMADLLQGTGWQLVRTFEDGGGPYTAVIEKGSA